MAHASPKQFCARLFPQRLLFLIDRLSAPELQAFMWIMHEYTCTRGSLNASDESMARVTRLSLKGWGKLKVLLVQDRQGRVEGGRWIDDDLDASIEIQRASRERGRIAALARYAARDERGLPVDGLEGCGHGGA